MFEGSVIRACEHNRGTSVFVDRHRNAASNGGFTKMLFPVIFLNHLTLIPRLLLPMDSLGEFNLEKNRSR